MQAVEVRSGGLVGLFAPAPGSPAPGVLILGGSEGGCPRYLAQLLAAQGFSCLALRYFGGSGLPRDLVEVPIDYAEQGVYWLLERPEVTGGGAAVLGASKGAELALVMASLVPQAVAAVVAYAPSSVTFAGISFKRERRRRSSWSWRGTPLPFVPYPERMRPSVGFRGVSLAPVYDAALTNHEAVATAAISIERSHAPVLLISGGRDRMWPSSAMAQMLESRLVAAGKRGQVTHLRYPHAGHSFMPWRPNLRSELLGRSIDSLRLAGFGGMFDFGGRPRANRDAHDDAWDHVTKFLVEELA